MAKVRITVFEKGLDDMIDAMDRVSHPSFTATIGLERVLGEAYAHTQTQTHILTGRLKASGRTESDFDGRVWTGEIKYGGADYVVPGIWPDGGTTAYYGIYEKARGGQHDFMTGLEIYADKFGDAMTEWFKANI